MKKRRELQHLANLAICPYLPEVEEALSAAKMRDVRGDAYGELFYEQALLCGQSLWRQGFPAQALLMFNRAFTADLDGGEEVLIRWSLPYEAMAWVMMHREEDQFIGNPRRHFQHLATRMVEPHKARRVARAWACWWMACRIYPDYPADQQQLEQECVVEPSRQVISTMLQEHGIAGEVELWDRAIALI